MRLEDEKEKGKGAHEVDVTVTVLNVYPVLSSHPHVYILQAVSSFQISMSGSLHAILNSHKPNNKIERLSLFFIKHHTIKTYWGVEV